MPLLPPHTRSPLGKKTEPDRINGRNWTLDKVTSRVMFKKEKCMNSFSALLQRQQLRADAVPQDGLYRALLHAAPRTRPKVAQVSWSLQVHCWREEGGRAR